MAIKPLSEETREEMVGAPPCKRQRVELEVEFRTADVASAISFKTGSSQVSSTVWTSFIHVEDAKSCLECLKWKHKATKRAWADADKTNDEMLHRE